VPLGAIGHWHFWTKAFQSSCREPTVSAVSELLNSCASKGNEVWDSRKNKSLGWQDASGFVIATNGFLPFPGHRAAGQGLGLKMRPSFLERATISHT
jgi:hypothetical protein